MLTKNCTNCSANYSTGKDYRNKWCCIPNPKDETKGLCEFCLDKIKTNAN